MAHFAKVLNGEVVDVIVAEESFMETFVDSSPGEWIQTSYNTRGGQHYDPETGEVDDGTPLRKNYAGVGFTYDAQADAFYPPKPYESWTLNEETYIWDAPSECPDDGEYVWNENSTSWVETTENN